MKKILILALSLALMVGCMAGCGSKGGDTSAASASPATSASATAIKIGGTGPLTGAAAIYGTAAKNGAQIAVDEINAMGESIQFDLKYQDDENDPEKGVNAYNNLKDWGMQISLGSVTSKPCEATSSLTYTDRIFSLTPSASSTAVTAGKDNQFQMCFSDPNQGTASAQYISDKKLGTKIAVIYKNDDVYSKGVYDKFNAKAKELGLNIVSATTFTDDSQTDFTVQLSEAQKAGADLLFLPMYYQPASLILSQAKSMNYAPKYFGIDGMDGILSMEGFDKSLAEGVMLLTPFNADATDEKSQNFVKKYKELYKETPNQFAADAYDCVYALYDVCKKTGVTSSMNASSICDKMIATFTDSSFKFDGITGTGMTWDKTGAVSKSPKAVVIKNGVYTSM